MPEILVIEDDIGISTAIRDNCRLRQYATRAAFDGITGQKLIQERIPDLVVLDIMMPRLNGYEVCRWIRKQGLEIPIIILSAKNREADIVKGLEAGADDYLVKPFGIEELFARVKVQLRRLQTATAKTENLDGSQFDPTRCCLVHDNVPIELTQKESGLLAYLIAHPDQALPRSKLILHVWKDDPAVSERSVDRCVTTLRSKLQANPKLQARIKTLRNIGYTFSST